MLGDPRASAALSEEDPLAGAPRVARSRTLRRWNDGKKSERGDRRVEANTYQWFDGRLIADSILVVVGYIVGLKYAKLATRVTSPLRNGEAT